MRELVELDSVLLTTKANQFDQVLVGELLGAMRPIEEEAILQTFFGSHNEQSRRNLCYQGRQKARKAAGV